MISLFTQRKKIAILLLALLSVQTLTPSVAYALTSGPAQPETKGFQVAGIADMVDLQSGDLKYNIPLLDIDGYPINLNYQSGTGIDDEASWVGLGWSLTPGAINRQVRGLPDDFSGDLVGTDHYVKQKITVGGKLTAKAELFGIAGLNGTFTFGIFSDNYTGLGAELGVNAGISYGMANDGYMTAGLGIGVLSNTQSGVDASVSPYVSLSVKELANQNMFVSAGLSGSFGYNTRSGLKSLTLNESFGQGNKELNDAGKVVKFGEANYSVGGSSISYNTQPISPSIRIPFTSDYSSFSFDVGGELFGSFSSIGGTGYKNVRQVKSVYNTKPAFGFLYAERGKDNQDALMDFIRENDNPVIPTLPDIALPIHMPDVWSYTSQTGGGQFRLFRGGSGAFFDNQAIDGSTVSTLGGDLGLGAWVHGGITHYNQDAKTTTRKWTKSNSYLANGDFQNPDYTNPNAEHAYFKQVGEKGLEDQDISGKLLGSQALEVATNGVTAQAALRNAGNMYATPAISSLPSLKKTTRRPNRTVISYLTAAEATQAALNKTIPYYELKDSTSIGTLTANPVHTDSSRVNAVRQPHHISEIIVTDDSGKKMVYGTPVYNISQDEYTFAIDPASRDGNNLVSTPSGITSGSGNPYGDPYGIDNYYQKEHKPAYATCYLLSAVLSPDYVDRTGNGITDDDLGTAIKFNYSKLPYRYKWRTPYSKATPNRGLMADPDDDKGSIIYGAKELCYVQSIESKTKIAYFITQERRDALGVTGWQNGGSDLTNKQRCLREIRLYSKADMTRPIKVVKFKYTYELCRGIPNSADIGSSNPNLGGKLTLSKIWFEYGNSDKGKYHAYAFQYNKTNATGTPVYGYNTTDRWGNYKPASENSNGLANEQYPYTNQNKTTLDANCALWHLNQITLPTGGVINITYEAGDYAYVQDKKAMVMTAIQGLINSGGGAVSLLNQASGISVNIGTDTIPPSTANQTTWFKNTFLNGADYLYTKLYVNMATNNYTRSNPLPYDMVPTYCLIKSVSITAGVAKIMFYPISESGVSVNPMSISAWQRLKNEYPRYAYPGFDNRVQDDNSGAMAAVSAVVSAAKNMTELQQSFYQKANKRNYASAVILGKSFVKLVKPTGFKLGGAARVKQIQIDDTWNSSDGANIPASYGQAYAYTTTENGRTISSGVATYEPSVGNDENPLKQPVPYIENIKGAINNYFDLELPFGESLYPAPTIGYSRVTVNDLDKNHVPSNQTGSVVNEFYTAKDFPVKVTALPVIPFNPKPHTRYSLTGSDSDDELSLSQGYSIELNDMAGKQKATTVLDKGGAVISATAYYYNAQDNGGTMVLNNNVNVIDPTTLLVTNKTIGRDIDFFTDFREQETVNNGQAINIGGDVFPIGFWFPFFGLPHYPSSENNDYKLFRSACAVKVVQSYGILSKVVKTENGSSITTENLAYDALTGEALVTRTKNEFKKDVYSINVPAYWVYKGMGAAYQNLGILLSGLKTNANGELTAYTGYLQGGDEILDTSTGNHYWVIDNQAVSGPGNTKKLIDRNGYINANYNPAALDKIVKSGYHNMLTASATTLVSLETPFTTDSHLKLNSLNDLTSMKVINASATTFDESWADGNHCISNQNDPTLNLITNETRDFSVSATSPIDSGAAIYSLTGEQYVRSEYWGGVGSSHPGRREVIGFWPTEAATKTYNPGTSQFTGDFFNIDVIVNFNQSKMYYFALSAPDVYGFTLDCQDGNPNEFSDVGSDLYVFPFFVTAGKHIIHYSFKLVNHRPPNRRTTGLEVYDNTFDELVNADSAGTGLNILFSTKGFVGKNDIYDSFDPNGYSQADSLKSNIDYHFTRPDGTPPFYKYSYCDGGSPVVNPYIAGYLGNWRPYQTKVFQQSRNYAFANNLNKAGMDLKDAGYINGFYSYWYLNSTSHVWVPNPNSPRWVTANTVTLYDKYGQQLENKDALGRYSAANFDFNGELPSSVASNAMNREIYAASLEDNRFTPGGSSNPDTCNVREFIQPSNHHTLKQLAVNTLAHSGNYSALLPAEGVTMATIIDTVHQKTIPYLALDNHYQYITQATTGLYPNGFEPYTGKSYLFNAWVNDGHPNDRTTRITLNINGNSVPLMCKAVVEGWKLMEGTMDLSTLGAAAALNIAIAPTSGSTIYIDDIRMHPVAAQMKSYAYDDKTMRLMAELDENAFATFYEYDDEGLLIRVKKETEKGIMTLKESRSSYRRVTP